MRRIADVTHITVHEVPTGTPVFDWVVPPEWNIRAASLETEFGEPIIDLSTSNLHVVGYSEPVDAVLTLDELQPHLHSDPSRPDVVPYRTSYYTRSWGFCLSHRQRLSLRAGRYRARIDSTLETGSLTYAEALIPGREKGEVIFYTHTCHPSLANDNLSGIAVCTYLAKWLSERQNRLNYRVVFGPGTIGSLTWLAANPEAIPKLQAGLVIALVGDRGPLSYKCSWHGDTLIDKAARTYLRADHPDASIVDFSPWGYDERQFNSPGFRLPVGRLTRSAEEQYPEYHSSADNLSLVSADSLAEAFAACCGLVEMLDDNVSLQSTSTYGEPQLGRRGVYRALGGPPSSELQRAMLWVLCYADGNHDLIDVIERSALPHATVRQAASLLRDCGLLT